MKKIKYIVSFFIIFLGFLIVGESHNFYIEGFSNKFYNTNFYMPKNIDDNEVFNDMESVAKKNNVVLFTYHQSSSSNLNSEIIVYGTRGIKDELYKELHIEDRQYKSIFLGDIIFKIKAFKDHPNIKKVNEFYIIGNRENVRQFKRELIDKYGGGFPKEGIKDNDMRNGIILMWNMIACIILFFTFYDTIFQKKENLIRITMGETLQHIILKNILIDLCTFVTMFMVIIAILSRYTYVFFMINITAFFFVILVILNSALYLNLFRYKIKEVFSNAKNSRKILTLNYGVKSITTILAIFIISSNIALIKQSYDLYTQRDFFEAHSDYYYTNLGYKMIVNSDNSMNSRAEETFFIQEYFYHKFFKEFNATVITDKISNLIGRTTIITNKNSYDYIVKNVEELKNINSDKDFYFLLPKGIRNKDEIIESIKSYIEFTDGVQDENSDHSSFDKKYDFQVISYEGSKKLIAIDNMSLSGSKYVKNPIIIYNNMELDKFEVDQNTSGSINEFTRDIMYKLTDKEFNKFIHDNKLEGEFDEKINVLDTYKYNWSNAKRALILNLIFSSLIILLEMIIIISIIKLEYEVNAIEISLKKVLGYTMFEKNKKILLMTIITSIFSILASVTLGLILRISEPYFLAAGGIVILILEVLVIIFYIRKVEYSKVTKILKGGSL